MSDLDAQDIAETIHDAIAEGMVDQYLASIERAIKSRRETIRKESGIYKGARVSVVPDLNHDTAGAEGYVVRVNAKTATVKLDDGREFRFGIRALVGTPPMRPSEAAMAEASKLWATKGEA